MSHKITVSKEVYAALQQQATRRRQTADSLAEVWLKQHLNLGAFPELEWREGPGGWRVGIKGTAIDVYTIAGYSQIGYPAEEIADNILPALSTAQVQAALRYYAEYPDEINQILADSEPDLMNARLYRTLGPDAYQQLTGTAEVPTLIRETQTKYSPDESDQAVSG